MLESYKWDGMDGWKSPQALILRAPPCGANKSGSHTKALKGLLIEHKSLFEFYIAFDDQFSLPPAKSDLNAFNTVPEIRTLNVNSQIRRTGRLLKV